MEQSTTDQKAPNVSEGLKLLLGAPQRHIFDLLKKLAQDGGARVGVKEKITPIAQERDYAGFRYSAQGWIQGHVLLAIAKTGDFIIESSLADSGFVSQRWDIYDAKGDWLRTEYEAPASQPAGEMEEMDLTSPMLNLLYNFLSSEYALTMSQKMRSQQVHTVERFIRTQQLPEQDALIQHTFQKILILEADPVLNWEERQIVYKTLLKRLKHILNVKTRAHGNGQLAQQWQMLKQRTLSFLKRIQARPLNNAKGLTYRYTVAKLMWFVNTVKSNLGYSVALAVYGPFTYYFITMPMNPHAMQAVGRVRQAYLDMKEKVSSEFIPGTKTPDTPTTQLTTANPVQVPVASDTGTALSATSPSAPATAVPINPNFIGISQVTSGPQVSFPYTLNGETQSVNPTHLNFPLTTNIPAFDNVPWTERMGNFKQMQIAYEENIEFASRMGRLEQLETQYNFPMVAESAWEEMERYNARIFRIRQRETKLSAKFKQFLTNEVNRAQQLELYIWDRLARFILDQPYVMLDQDGEQKRNDFYVGRSFIFMEEMTQILSWRYPDFQKPHGYEKIAKVAARYKGERKEAGNIFGNLKANSDLFRQQDAFSTAEFRSYMKRQWEVLYLQNAKAEEASNNGLNLYIWSVRNTLWCLQSLYSAKRQELDLLVQRDLEGQLDGMGLAELAKTEMLQETLFHNLTMEWVGVKEELGNKLAKDIESAQRKTVIENIKESLMDRAKLFNQFDAQKQAQAAQ